jgi:hypothetical protein
VCSNLKFEIWFLRHAKITKIINIYSGQDIQIEFKRKGGRNLNFNSILKKAMKWNAKTKHKMSQNITHQKGQEGSFPFQLKTQVVFCGLKIPLPVTTYSLQGLLFS